jgi:hypothetical protein
MILVVRIQDVGEFDIIDFEIRIPPDFIKLAETNLKIQ